MKIEIIPCLQDNYSYLIIDETNNNACVITYRIVPYINIWILPLLIIIDELDNK